VTRYSPPASLPPSFPLQREPIHRFDDHRLPGMDGRFRLGAPQFVRDENHALVNGRSLLQSAVGLARSGGLPINLRMGPFTSPRICPGGVFVSFRRSF
jgi:hypothetical protein